MSLPINVPGLSELLQRAFGLQGRVRPVLEESVVPVIQVGDLSAGTPPPVTRHATARCFQSAVALERFVARLECPGNVIIEVRKLIIAPAAGGVTFDIRFGAQIAVPANTADKQFTDGRLLESGQSPAGVLSFGTHVDGINNPSWRTHIPDFPNPFVYDVPRGWIIGSGGPTQFGFVDFAYNQLNEAMTAFVVEWDEYQIV